MIFEALDRLGSKADRVILYPDTWNTWDKSSVEGHLLAKAQDVFKVRLIPIVVQHTESEESTWEDSFTKLLVFNQTQYDRVVIFDSDATVLQVCPVPFLSTRC
jgi:alpha-N-acetylglucosamine transferase